jgi:hypothetical protein
MKANRVPRLENQIHIQGRLIDKPEIDAKQAEAVRYWQAYREVRPAADILTDALLALKAKQMKGLDQGAMIKKILCDIDKITKLLEKGEQ